VKGNQSDKGSSGKDGADVSAGTGTIQQGYPSSLNNEVNTVKRCNAGKRGKRSPFGRPLPFMVSILDRKLVEISSFSASFA